MRAESCIDYVEIPVTDLNKAKEFFSALFGWSFELWGDDYMSFNDGRFDGGFRRSPEPAPSTGVLLIFFSTDLERDFDSVQELGATISEATFRFLAVDDFISWTRRAMNMRSGQLSPIRRMENREWLS